MMQSSEVTLRLMTADDLPMLHEWLNRAHVVEWWGSEAERLSFDEVRAKYLPRVTDGARVTPYIAMLDDRAIGYAQSYAAKDAGGGWWEDVTDPGVRGIDQFLANENLLGQGWGTKLVTSLVDLLFRDPLVTMIQTDPDPNNARAIRCYEKAGFQAERTVVTPDGEALYMVCERSHWECVRTDHLLR